MKRTGGLRRGKPLQRRAPLKHGKPMKRTSIRRRAKPRIPLFDDRAMSKAWHDEVIATAPKNAKGRLLCPVCDHRPTRENPLEAHHVTTQELIRKYVRALRLPAFEASEMLARLRWDKRNGLPVCRRCHVAHTTALRRIPLRLVTYKARQFAREVLAEFLLDRYYER